MMGNVGRDRATVALNFGGEEVYSCLAAVVGPSCEICYDPEVLAFDYVIEFNIDDPFDEYAQETIASYFTKAYNVVYNDAGIRITTSMVEGQFEEDSDGTKKNVIRRHKDVFQEQEGVLRTHCLEALHPEEDSEAKQQKLCLSKAQKISLSKA
eukprot:scaffold128046_cov54-Attheya_sp.AAC.2